MEERILYHEQKENILDNMEKIEDKISSVKEFINTSLKSRNLSIFLGSGCSTPEIPLMAKTIETMLKKPSNSDIKDKIIEFSENGELKGFSDIEGFLNWLQFGINYEKNESKIQDLNEVFNNTKKEFLLSISDLKRENYCNSNTAVNYHNFYRYIFGLRETTKSKISIFTSNYDLFSEYALTSNDVFYSTGFSSNIENEFDINQFKYRVVDDTEKYKDKWQPVKKEANLYKLHGSINWERNSEGKIVQKSDNTSNSIIYPTLLKNKETTEAPYSTLFREFSNDLQKESTTLIVIGYGFPDEHINDVISQNLNNDDFKLVIFGDVSEENLKKFMNSHESKNNLHIIGGVIKKTLSEESVEKKYAHHFEVIIDNFFVNEI